MQKAYRLTNSASFSYVYRKGKSEVSRLMAIAFVPARSLKVGVSVSKKIGKSVERNLVKRRIKENFRKLIPAIESRYNYVVSARPAILGASYQEIGEDMARLLKKADLMTEI